MTSRGVNSPRDPMRLAAPDPAIRTRRSGRAAAVIARVAKLTHDTIEVVARALAPLPPARAGQFFTLAVPGVARPRAYSLARAPHTEKADEHTFFIRLVPGGELSGWFGAADRAGTRIELCGPLGRFGLDRSAAPILCIAGGSGMSAMFAVLEEACANQVARDCHFFYGARTAGDLFMLSELAAIRDAWHPENRFEFTPVLSAEPSHSNWQGERGWVHAAAGKLENFDWPRAIALLCGPPPMIDSGIEMLRAAGMPPGRCIYDRFEDATSNAPVIDNVRCVLCDECLVVKPIDDCIVETAELELGSDGSAGGFQKLVPLFSSGLYYNTLYIDEARCIRCQACVEACPHGAITTDRSPRIRTLRQGV